MMQTIRAETAEAEGKRLQAEVEQLQRLQRFAGKIRMPWQNAMPMAPRPHTPEGV
jgi:hypothetical protein